MFAPAGQTTARAGQLCWLAALVVRRQALPPPRRPEGWPPYNSTGKKLCNPAGRRGRRPLQLKCQVVPKARCGGQRTIRPTEQQRKSERGKGGRMPSPDGAGGAEPRPYAHPIFHCGGSGALGGAQRAPPASKAGPLVRLFAPQGQTLLAPQFRSAQLWPRARNPATPDSKTEEGPLALSANSNTAFA